MSNVFAFAKNIRRRVPATARASTFSPDRDVQSFALYGVPSDFYSDTKSR